MRFHPCRLPHLILSGPFLLPQSLISLFCIMQHFQDKLCNVLTFAGLVGVIVWGTVSLWPEAEATPLLQPEAEELSADTLPADTLPELPLTEDLPVVQEEVLSDSLLPDTLPAADIQPDQPADTATLQHHAASQHEEAVTSEEKPETPKKETE
ncbi:hypothetical protein MR642_09880 [bacterium]|nr:hypothetical protein [bacterium]